MDSLSSTTSMQPQKLRSPVIPFRDSLVASSIIQYLNYARSKTNIDITAETKYDKVIDTLKNDFLIANHYRTDILAGHSAHTYYVFSKWFRRGIIYYLNPVFFHALSNIDDFMFFSSPFKSLNKKTFLLKDPLDREYGYAVHIETEGDETIFLLVSIGGVRNSRLFGMRNAAIRIKDGEMVSDVISAWLLENEKYNGTPLYLQSKAHIGILAVINFAYYLATLHPDINVITEERRKDTGERNVITRLSSVGANFKPEMANMPLHFVRHWKNKTNFDVTLECVKNQKRN